MPIPAAIKFQPGRLRLDSGFTVGFCDTTGPRAQRGIERALHRLAERTGLTISRAWVKETAATLFVCAKGIAEKVQDPEEDETYLLRVSAGRAELRANTEVGILRGLETFLQLIEAASDGFYLPFVLIEDRPRFRWRGLLIDVCRHWEPVEVIKRNVDAMAAFKLNVFHWHLSEDQGVRVESRTFPKLQQMGSDGLYYTQAQIREVVEYAHDRGIRVLPEFDMPGHSTAWFVAYPEYASGPGPYTIERNFGIFSPTFDPTREEVYRFIDRFVGEMASLFPDAYWHVGGDEVDGKQWDANPAIRAFKRQRDLKDNLALQAHFNERVLRILQKHRKTMVGWDEILNPNLPKDVVVQSWRGQDALMIGVKQGISGILSAGYYLDAFQSAAQHYAVDPWPPSAELDTAQASRVLGGEACMWGESVTPENIDSRIWPRTAAIAERLWSPREVTDVEDMYRRLASVSVQLEELGLTHLSGPDFMLRRIAGSESIDPLRKLLAVVEPANPRSPEKTQLTPLTSLADAAVPDPPARREIEALVDAVIRDPAGSQTARDKLAAWFQDWRELPPALGVLVQHAPVAAEASRLAADLMELGAAGQEALVYLSLSIPPPKAWAEERLALVKRVSETKASPRIVVTPAVEKLIAAAARPPLQNPAAR